MNMEYRNKKVTACNYPFNEEAHILINEIFRLFIIRTDCYAIQRAHGYIRLDEPLTRQVVEAHLKGEKTIGAYQLSPKNNTVKYLCFDLDPEHLDYPKLAAEKIIKVCFEKPDAKYPRIWEDSLLLEASRYPDPSYHVWIFFLVPLPARAARWLGYRILELAELNPAQIEVFPKQDELSNERPYGNFVKLPLGFHRVEKKWSRFLDPFTFEPLEPDIITEISGISFSEADTQKILELASRKKAVQVKLVLPDSFKPLPDREEEKAVQFLTRYWKPGYRNRLEISFLGFCIKRGISRDSAYRIIDEVTRRTHDEERVERLRLVDYHYRNRLNVPLKATSGLREIIREMIKGDD